MNDILISALIPYDAFSSQYDTSNHYWGSGGCMGNTTRDSSGNCTIIEGGLAQITQVLRIEQGETPSTRIIGLKVGTNPDGSYQIKLLGNNINYSSVRKFKTYGLVAGIRNTSPEYNATSETYSAGLINLPTPRTNNIMLGSNANTVSYIVSDATMLSGSGPVSSDGSFLSQNNVEELPALNSYSTISGRNLIEYAGNFTSSSISGVTITTNVNSTPTFGLKNITNVTLNRSYEKMVISPWFIKGGKIDPIMGLTGNNYDYISDMLNKIIPQANAQVKIPNTSRRLYFTLEDSTSYLANEYYFGIRYDNLHITSDYDKAIAYLTTGAIPDDDEYTERNPSNPNPYNGEVPPEPPEVPEKQVGNNDNNVPEHTSRAEYAPNTSNNLTGINWYYIHKSKLESFINWFWNDMTDWSSILMNWVTGLYGDLQNAIISLKKIHVAETFLLESANSGGRHTTSDIKLARFTCTLTGEPNYLWSLDSELTGLKYVGGIRFLENDDIYSFLTYSPYRSVSLYLPYVGIVPLDTRYLHPNEGDSELVVNIACGASYMTGEIIYRVQMGDCDVAYYQGKCSEDVPFSMNSAIQLATNTVNAIGNVSAGLIGGGVGVATTQLLGQNIASPSNTNASVTSTLNKYLGSKCAIIVQQPQYFKVYDTGQNLKVKDYAKSKGYKFNCVRTFKAGDGYTEFVNPHIDNWQTAPTETEIQEIYSLMESGIVL